MGPPELLLGRLLQLLGGARLLQVEDGAAGGVVGLDQAPGLLRQEGDVAPPLLRHPKPVVGAFHHIDPFEVVEEGLKLKAEHGALRHKELAIEKIEPEAQLLPESAVGSVPLELAGIPQVNTAVYTYGFPVGGDRISVTKGIVSRIESDTYAHSGADQHLVIQTDAAINPGNSGGPVVQDGRVVGVAFQGLREAENIGYLIPTVVISHFLTDTDDGKYDGFGTLGVRLYPGLHNPSYKGFLKVPPDQDGVVVIGTMMHSSVESILQPNDVLTRIDDYNIDDDGMVSIYGLKLHFAEIVETKQIGETVELTFYRDGQAITKAATVGLNRPILDQARQYDRPGRYVCFAGLVFVPATRNFLETWGRRWPRQIPFDLRYLLRHSHELNEDRERTEYVVLSQILPDEVNTYARRFKNQVVQSVNDIVIHSLGDVHKAFQQPVEKFHTIRYLGDNRVQVIDADKAGSRHPAILRKYQVPAEARLE